MIKKIKRSNLRDEITSRLLKQIETGEWEPLQRIPGEVELAKSFEVSRNVVRESLKTLESLGVLNSKAGSGTFVSENLNENISRLYFFNELKESQSLDKLMETRLIIEPKLCGLGALKRTKKDIKNLHIVLEESLKMYDKGTYTFEDGYKIHAAIHKCSKNDMLITFMGFVLANVKYSSYSKINKYISEEDLIEDMNNHKNIILAIENKDEGLAERLMHEHIYVRMEKIGLN